MTHLDFLQLINSNYYLLFLSIIISLCIYIPIMYVKKCFIFSPYIMSFYNSIAATAVIFFLFFTKNIPVYFVRQFFLSEFFFYIGFLIYIPIKSSYPKVKNTNQTEKWVFIISFFLFFSSQTLIYKIWGIPIFLDSRLEQNFTGGGSGLFLRINKFFAFFCLYKAFFDVFFLKRKLNGKIFLGLYLVILLLSGSKSSILSVITFFYSFALIYKNDNPSLLATLHKNIVKLLFATGIFLLVAFWLQSNGNLLKILSKVFFRIISQGDCIFFAYPKSTINQIDSFGTLRMVFSDLFITLRLLPSALSFPTISLDLYQMVTGTEILSGPVLPHNILGYIQYGFYGSLIFSFILGLFMNLIYSSLKSVSRSHIGKVVQLYIYNMGPLILYSLNTLLGSITNLFIFMIFILIIYFLIFFLKPSKELEFISHEQA